MTHQYDYDDHCLVVLHGAAWRIRSVRIDKKCMVLESLHDWVRPRAVVMDFSRVDWDRYCEEAARLIGGAS